MKLGGEKNKGKKYGGTKYLGGRKKIRKHIQKSVNAYTSLTLKQFFSFGSPLPIIYITGTFMKEFFLTEYFMQTLDIKFES